MESRSEYVLPSNLPQYVKENPLEAKLDFNQIYPMQNKYLGRDGNGEVNETPTEAAYRIAKTMAEIERQYGADDNQIAEFTKKFYEPIANFDFVPAGRIWSNAGTDVKGLFNCYVLPVEDSMDLDVDGSIFTTVAKAAVIHKNGGGTGYNFSKLRPRGTFVQKSRGIASGPVSFISQFDKETEVINSGNRRGANMGILNVDHPDILDFIYAKSRRGEITNFNVSVGIYDRFMDAVNKNGYYTLEFNGEPFSADNLKNSVRNIEQNKIGGAEVGQQPKPSSLRFDSEDNSYVPGKTNIIDTYSGEVAGRVNEESQVQLFAPYVFNTLTKLAYETADPGVIFLDAINKDNPLPNLGDIEATNPCGEQPLHNYDACNLGSINLSNMIQNNGENYFVDNDKIRKTVKTAVRFMDNVNDANVGPIPQIEETVKKHRRIGLGVMGWADMLVKLGVQYDSQEAYNLAEEVMGIISDEAKKASVELAREKGVMPAYSESKYNDGTEENMVRNLQRTTIAPNGTIGMVAGVVGGIEPFYALAFAKNIRGGDSLAYKNPLFEEALIKKGYEGEDLEKILKKVSQNHGSAQGIDEIPEDLRKIFRTAHDIPVEGHVLAQAAFQRSTDNAVSKTINLKEDASVDEVKTAYLMAYEHGLKGITVYRDGSKDVQVLDIGSKKSLENLERRVNPEKLPDIMPGIRIRQRTPWGNMHTFVVYDPKNNNVKETFAQLGKAGAVVGADLEGINRMVSMILRSGGTSEMIIDQLSGIGSNQSIVGRDGGVSSLPDAVSKVLQKYDFLSNEGLIDDLTRKDVDLTEIANKVADALRTGNGISNKENEDKGNLENGFAEVCPECQKSPLIHSEGCLNCVSCGYSKCG
jgi:ribonucleoside-diphosphate reductase alpha chain